MKFAGVLVQVVLYLLIQHRAFVPQPTLGLYAISISGAVIVVLFTVLTSKLSLANQLSYRSVINAISSHLFPVSKFTALLIMTKSSSRSSRALQGQRLIITTGE